MNQNFQEDDLIIPVEVDPQDINQEIELLKLEGIKNPSRSLIERRMKNHQPLLFGITTESFINEPLPWQTRSITSLEDTSALTEWALSKSDRIQDLILNFLEEPKEDEVDQIISQLEKEGIEIHRSISIKEIPLWKQLLDQIQDRGFCTISELYEYGRSYITFSKRPEAAVRQAIRRLLKAGLIIKEEQDVYSISR